MSSKYEIRFAERAIKEFNKLDGATKLRIARATKILASNPFPPKAKRVVGFDYWRIRVGDYRIIYEIHGKDLVVLVVRLGHRSNVYKRLD